MRYQYKPSYRRNLPHIHSLGATFFITFRLAGSIPKDVIKLLEAVRQLLEREPLRIEKQAFQNEGLELEDRRFRLEFRRRWFLKFESMLDSASIGPVWLKDERIASLVADSLHTLDGQKYKLHAFCIMANHVHLLITPFLNERLIESKKEAGRWIFETISPTMASIMQSIKGYTAREANKILGRKGRFWQAESYDHEVRNESEFSRIVTYILNNPVKAGLVTEWSQWKWNWRDGK